MAPQAALAEPAAPLAGAGLLQPVTPASAEAGALWLAVLALYAAASLACFIAYWRDKRAAERGAQRTPELTLLLIGLAGGWPGGLLAQQLFRHKTVKTSFLAKYWLTVALNLGALLALAR